MIAKYATYRVWVKANGEMPYLYGNHVLKAHVGRISEDTPEHQGVVIYAMNDTPLVSHACCPSDETLHANCLDRASE